MQNVEKFHYSFVNKYLFLWCRNCLVGRGYQIKLADVAMCSGLYHKDYSEIGSRPPAPIRWLPWESILLVSITTVRLALSPFKKGTRGYIKYKM